MLTRGTDRLRLAWAAIVLFGLAVVGCGGNANNVFTGRVDASAPLGSGQGLMLGVGDASTGRACTPTTCPKAGFTCGKNSDGCGGIIDCGACSGTDLLRGWRVQPVRLDARVASGFGGRRRPAVLPEVVR